MDNRTIRVLSIEDNPGDTLLIEEKLSQGSRMGWDLPTFAVESVSRLHQGLTRLEAAAAGQQPAIDVVLTDLDLPDSQAGETFETLRQRYPHLPIVVLTGREDAKLARTSVKAGAQDYLYKNEATGSLLVHALIYAIERQDNARALQEAHDQLEQRVERRTHELQERLKELTCLYAVNRDLQADLSTDELCQRTVENLAAAMAFPDLAIPVIEMDDRRYTIDPEPDGTSTALRAPIKVGGEVRGHVQVTYAEAQASLLPEEQHLVDGVAEALSTWLARNRAESQRDATIETLSFQAQLLDSVREAVVATDLEGRVIYWGKGAEALYGWSAKEVMEEPVSFIVDARDVDAEEARMRQVRETGHWRGEYRQKRKDGTSFWSDTSISVVRDREGQPCGMIGIDRDVTARKQAESQQEVMLRALRANEERLRMTLELSPMGVGIVDSGGHLIDCNAALMEIVGYDRDALLQMNYADFTHPEDLAREEQLIAELWDGKATEYRMEKRYLHRDGHVVWVDVSASLFKDERGHLAYGFAFVREITEGKRAEQILRKSEEKYRRLVEGSPDILYLYSEERGAIYWSQRVQDVLGYAPDELLEHPYLWHDAIHPDDVAEVDAAIIESARGARFDLEYRIHDTDGDWHWFHDRFIGKRQVEGETIIEGLASDITERKQAEEALHESLTRYDELVRSIPVGVYVLWTRAGGSREFEYVSERWCEMHQLSREAALADAEDVDRKIVHPEELEAFVARNQEAHRNQQSFLWEGRFVVGDEIRWLHLESMCETFDNGDTRWFGVTQDITERKQAEMALRKSETRFRTIINALPQFVAYTDRDLVYRFVNRTYQQKFGVRPEDVVGKTLPEVIGQDAFEEARPHVEKALSGEQVRYHERYDYAIGGTRDIDGILVPDVAEDGEVRGYYAVLTDITPYMEIQEELRQTTERLQIEHEIDTAILRAQSAGEIAQAALTHLHDLIPCRYLSIAEMDPRQQRGRDMIVLFDGEIQPRPSAWRPMADAGPSLLQDIQHGHTYVVGDLTALASRSPRQQELADLGIRATVSVPLRMHNATLGTLNAASETPDFFQPQHVEILEEVAASLAVAIQQAHLLEQTRRDAETKDLLLREVNHRVKNNMDAIIGLLYVERRYAPPGALPVYRPIMEDLTRRIASLALVHQMLSASEWAPLRVNELAEQIIQRTAQGANEDLNVTLNVAPSPVRVRPAQAQHLALILSELTTNTLKYAVADHDTVNVKVRISQEGDTIQLVYRDDGPGYPQDVLNLKQHSAGLEIIQRSVATSLRGSLTLRNEGGAVTAIRFPKEH